MDASAGGSAGGSGPRVTKQTRSTKWFYQQRFLGVGAAADARLNRLAEVAAERWDSFRGASGSGSGILDSSQFGHHVGADTFKNPRTQAMFEAFGIKERSEDIRTLIFAACTGNRQMRGLLCGQILDLANADHSLNLNGILNAAIRDGNEAACDAVVDAAAEVCSRDIVATMNSHTGPVNGADGARAWTPALLPLKGLERVNRLIVGIMTRGLHAPRSFRTANWILDQEIKIKRTASLILEMIMHRIRPAGPRAWCRAQAALAILTFGMLTARMHDFFATLSLTDTYLTVRGTADEAAGKLDESIGLLTQDKRLAWSRAELQKEQAKVSTKPKSKTKADKEEQRGQAAATAQAKPELDLNSLLAAAARFDKSIPIKAQYIAGGQVQTVMASAYAATRLTAEQEAQERREEQAREREEQRARDARGGGAPAHDNMVMSPPAKTQEKRAQEEPSPAAAPTRKKGKQDRKKGKQGAETDNSDSDEGGGGDSAAAGSGTNTRAQPMRQPSSRAGRGQNMKKLDF